MTHFKPGKLAILAVLGALALGSAACAYDDYGDHHHRGGHDRGSHGGRGDHGRGDHDGRGDHRGGH
jgi:hypothetical protein